ncbi:hypothetical protein [Rhizobium sp. AAP43]|uniref:hypothetical protein n=1 Tax=Rhizobium sp. AAP43 TaxID=1523420 RepID=UPI0012E2FC5A|nr:hypothetical protein [Rhizobium sp. AAP43]
MDPSEPAVLMVAAVAVFAIVGLVLSELSVRRTQSTRMRDRSGDGATTFSDDNSGGDDGDCDGGGDGGDCDSGGD